MLATVISALALVVSIGSAIVSVVALRRDRHIIKARSTAWEDQPGKWALTVTVSNAGRRPVSIAFVTVNVPNIGPRTRQFTANGNGNVRLDVGESTSTSVIFPSDKLAMWTSLDELRASKVLVQDALGKNYAALFR